MNRLILALLTSTILLAACADQPTAPLDHPLPSFSEEESPCPDGSITITNWPVGDDPDDNENGVVCTFDFITFFDDTPVSTGLTLTAGKVNGHANFESGGDRLSFSFHAESDGTTISGNFEFHNRTTRARYHGDVTCMEIAPDGSVLMEGVVTNNKKDGPDEGSVVGWAAVDNGEGRNADPDEASAPELAPPPPGPACAFRPSGITETISGGNIQVR